MRVQAVACLDLPDLTIASTTGRRVPGLSSDSSYPEEEDDINDWGEAVDRNTGADFALGTSHEGHRQYATTSEEMAGKRPQECSCLNKTRCTSKGSCTWQKG